MPFLNINEFENYLRLSENQMFHTSISAYLTKIKVFIEYIESELNLDNLNLRYISEEQILDSIKYYIDTRRIKFKITVDNYFTVVKAFFDYQQQEHGVTNDLFNARDRLERMKSKIDEIIKSYELNETEPKSIIDEDVYRNIIYECNNVIGSHTPEQIIEYIKTHDYHGLYTNFLSSVTSKLILFTGTKNQVLVNLERDCFGDLENTISIQNYLIHLPFKLGNDLKKYIVVRNWIIENNPNSSGKNKLFVKSNGESFSIKDYRIFFYILKKIIDNQEAESLSKYAICKMMESDIPRKQIMEFTGFKYETYLHCEESLYEKYVEKYGNKNSIIKNESEHLDSKLRGLNTFIDL